MPSNSSIRTPVDVELKPNWHFEPRRRAFRSESGEEFKPGTGLPKNTRIVYKVPRLAQANETELSRHEMELRRYMLVILPRGRSPGEYVQTIQSWPCVAKAHVAPQLSLP